MRNPLLCYITALQPSYKQLHNSFDLTSRRVVAWADKFPGQPSYSIEILMLISRDEYHRRFFNDFVTDGPYHFQIVRISARDVREVRDAINR
jgi:hypothetical protein